MLQQQVSWPWEWPVQVERNFTLWDSIVLCSIKGIITYKNASKISRGSSQTCKIARRCSWMNMLLALDKNAHERFTLPQRNWVSQSYENISQTLCFFTTSLFLALLTSSRLHHRGQDPVLLPFKCIAKQSMFLLVIPALAFRELHPVESRVWSAITPYRSNHSPWPW